MGGASLELWIVVLIATAAAAVAAILGFMIGIGRNLREEKKISDIEKLAYEEGKIAGTAINKYIMDNVGVGAIVFDSKGRSYMSDTMKQFSDLYNHDAMQSIESFVSYYGRNNALKFYFALSDSDSEEGNDWVQSYYYTAKKVYEIKIKKTRIEGNDEIFHLVIVGDVTEVKDYEKRQSDLAANITHELKTPITVFTNIGFLLKEIRHGSIPTITKLNEWGNSVYINAVRMKDIVDSFLTLSRNRQGERMRLFEIFPVLNNAYDFVGSYQGRDTVNINRPERESYPILFGDEKLVQQIVTNFLTNAIKYNYFEGKTEPNKAAISVGVLSDRIAIQVIDNGKGIPAQDIEHITERFYRVDNSGSREVGGAGLGLSIAMEIAELHDGNISPVSKVGEGSTFTLFLPTARTVFETVISDARNGVIQDKSIYKSAAKYLAGHLIDEEYEDMKLLKAEWELAVKEGRGDSNEVLIKVISSFSDDRVNRLIEDLTYIDEDFLEEDDTEEEYETFDMESEPEVLEAPIIESVNQVNEEAVSDNKEELAAIEEAREAEAREAEEREKKQAAREYLQQEVLPRTGGKKPLSAKEKIRIHPKSFKDVYNKGSERQSAVKKMLDNDQNKGV